MVAVVGMLRGFTSAMCRKGRNERGYAERLNGKRRDEPLSRELFCTVAEARALIEGWREHGNRFRRHSVLG